MRKYTLSIVALISLLLRLGSINGRPLWYDEAFAILFSEKGPHAMFLGTLTQQQGVAADVHPLAYYTVLWLWMRVFGSFPLSVRLLSVILGLGLMGVAYLLAKELFAERFAPVLALLVGISPFQIHYSQEVRMYAMLAFFLALATLALWKGLHTGQTIWWVVFSVAAAFAQYTHNLAVFYLLPLALTPVLFRQWRFLPAVILAGLGSIGLYLPWLILVPSQFAKVQAAYWTVRPDPSRLVTTLLSFVTNLPLPGQWLPWGLFVSVFVFALCSWQTAKMLRSGAPSSRRGLWLAYLGLTPPLLLFVFSQWQPVYIERALLPSGVMFLLWVGWSFTQTNLPKNVSGVAFLVLFLGMAIGVYQHSTYRGFPYAPYAELDAYLAANVGPEDVLLHSNKLTMLPAVYYDRDLPQRYLADPPGSGSDTLAFPTQKVLGLMAYPSLKTATGGAQTVWFLIFSRAIEEYGTLETPGHPHLQWLNAHYRMERRETWGDLLLYVYSK